MILDTVKSFLVGFGILLSIVLFFCLLSYSKVFCITLIVIALSVFCIGIGNDIRKDRKRGKF